MTRVVDTDLGIGHLRAAYLAGRLTPGQVVDGVLTARDASDPAIWIDRVPAAEVISRAASLERDRRASALPLYGIPFAVKDNMDVAGRPTTAACPSFARTATRTATAVRLLEDAGAILVGKTNLDQFATGLVGTRSPYGTPRNPLAPDHVPGGSSSGSAVAVAAGLVSIALGTDTAGSGRVPAAMTGTVGWKPSPGVVSTAGVLPACASLDTVSVFARSVADARTVAEVLLSHDPADPWSLAPARRPRADWPDLAAPRIGVPDGAGLDPCDAPVRAAFEAHVTALSPVVGTPVTIPFAPFLEVADLLYDGPWVAERLTALDEVLDDLPDADPTVRSILERARSIGALDAFRGMHRLQELRAVVDTRFGDVDVLLVPSVPTMPTLAEVAADPVGTNTRLGLFTNFANLLGMTAVAVPMGTRADGLPVGVTVLARGGNEFPLLALASRVAAAAAASAAAVAPTALVAGGTEP